MNKIDIALAIAGGYVAAFLLPVVNFIVIIGALVFADLITGVRAAKHRGEYDNAKASEGFRRSVDKMVMYLTAILLARGVVVAFNIPVEYLPLTYIMALYIAIVELKSNLENVAQVTGIDLWLVIADKLKALVGLDKKPQDTDGDK